MTLAGDDFEHLQATALHAARAVIAFLPIADLSVQDREDIRQSAILGGWLGWQRQPGNFSYAWRAAYNESLKFVIRQMFGRNPFVDDAQEFDETRAESLTGLEARRGLPDEIKKSLYAIFLSSRSKRGARGERAARRETLIMDLIWRGYRDIGIANTLGISEGTAKRARLVARHRLRASLSV